VALLLARARTRRAEREVQREKLDSTAEGHRAMAESHTSRVDELGAAAKEHREAAARHQQEAEKLEDRVAREGREAAFHEERASDTEHEREQL